MIKIKNLCFSYNKKPPYMLSDVSLNINKGAYVSIVGANGSYKSTFVKLLINELKPCKGDIIIDTNEIGYVPQKSDDFNSQFSITVNEVLACHANAIKLNDKSIIYDSLKKINMLDFKNKLIGTLSGGQRQKIMITRALMGYPKLLILDELSTGIDSNSQNEIYSFLKDINLNYKITVISVEHNIANALEYSTHILSMENNTATLYTVTDYKKHLNKTNKFLGGMVN